jgi:hypothetical protein
VEEESETTFLEKMIETKERTLALEKAIEVQVSPSTCSLLSQKALNEGVFMFIETASSSWSCK